MIASCGNRRHLRSACLFRSTRVQVTLFCFIVAVANALHPSAVHAASFSDAEKLFRQGKYGECTRLAQFEVDRGVWNENWSRLLVRCHLTTGSYGAAKDVYENAIKRYSTSIQLRLLGRDVYRYNNDVQAASREFEQIYILADRSSWRYTTPTDQAVLGQYFLAKGEDARHILEVLYDPARNKNPGDATMHVAIAELALLKHDYQLAAQSLEQALKLREGDPHIYQLQSQAWAESDHVKSQAALAMALKLNPNHIPSILLQVDAMIDAERYDDATKRLFDVLSINVYQPEAWAYHAVIAHLEGNFEGEALLRRAALSKWKSNPLVDHLIGKKLSQKYRFAEGAKYQERAMQLDQTFVEARFQLAQDLLRLGDERDGWKLADQVFKDDNYNVVAHNLITLRNELQRFTTLTRGDLVVRMNAREARIYGEDVLTLLEDARSTLCKKYDITPDKPVVVEIFPQQKDFAIRTFGLPGGAGFLGVCFGRVITANSPASQGDSPANWKSVLWHEFCHVVTLEKTNNRMPRWLSEGISVYEERQKNASWGQTMTPQYREMILGDDFVPVSELSGAFLQPKSGLHLQFAYYESSLVVEFMIERYGFDVLKRVLVDLSAGMPINESLQRYSGSLEQLDQEFAEYARERANALAKGVDWSKVDLPERGTADTWKQWLDDHPNNYWGLRGYATALMAEDKWQEAKGPLEQLQKLYPHDASGGNAKLMLARVHRELNETAEEIAVLSDMADLSSDAVAVYQRLARLHQEANHWKGVGEMADKLLAVNPLISTNQQIAADAAEKLNDHRAATSAFSALLEMDPIDPALVHYRLAKSLDADGQTSLARRQVLMALEEAPRYRDAQRLLLKIVDNRPATNNNQNRPPEPKITNTREAASE